MLDKLRRTNDSEGKLVIGSQTAEYISSQLEKQEHLRKDLILMIDNQPDTLKKAGLKILVQAPQILPVLLTKDRFCATDLKNTLGTINNSYNVLQTLNKYGIIEPVSFGQSKYNDTFTLVQSKVLETMVMYLESMCTKPCFTGPLGD
jgi:uncharacterized protein YqgQ